MPRGSKSINRPPTPEPEDQSRELSLEEDIRLRVRLHAQYCQSSLHCYSSDTRSLLLCSWSKVELSTSEYVHCAKCISHAVLLQG